jgi:hypothetical protein
MYLIDDKSGYISVGLSRSSAQPQKNIDPEFMTTYATRKELLLVDITAPVRHIYWYLWSNYSKYHATPWVET